MEGAPTPPWRILFTLALMWQDTQIADTDSPPSKIILIGLMIAGHAHALAFQLPAIWSARVHRRDCMQLIEHMLLYAIVHAIALVAIIHQGGGVAATGTAHCCFYFAWSVLERLSTWSQGTLVAWALRGSMLAYLCLTLPVGYFLAHSLDVHEWLQTKGHPWDIQPPALLRHLLAWIVADVCHYVFHIVVHMLPRSDTMIACKEE
jgi:hypothetical protein